MEPRPPLQQKDPSAGLQGRALAPGWRGDAEAMFLPHLSSLSVASPSI